MNKGTVLQCLDHIAAVSAMMIYEKSAPERGNSHDEIMRHVAVIREELKRAE